MLFLTAFGHEGCYSQSSVNLVTRYKACQLLASRLGQSVQDDDEHGLSGDSAHSAGRVALASDGLVEGCDSHQRTRAEYARIYKLHCKFCENFNANNKYCFTLRTLASDKLDEGYDSHHLIRAEYAGVLPGYSLQWLTGLEDKC